MTVRFEVTHPRLGAWGITLPAYKWGYVSGTEFLMRAAATTAWGRQFRIPINDTRRGMTVTFREIDTLIDALRTITVFAHRFVRPVRFYPNYDTAPGTYWVLDWAQTVTFNRVLDNREEVELVLLEQVPEP